MSDAARDRTSFRLNQVTDPLQNSATNASPEMMPSFEGKDRLFDHCKFEGRDD